MIRAAGPVLGALFLLACSLDEPGSRRFGEPVHGISVSTHPDGRDWAWDPMVHDRSRRGARLLQRRAVNPLRVIERVQQKQGVVKR